MPPDADSMWELNLIIGVCNLRKAHAQHVAELFEAEGCFQKALQKAFGVICNQDFAGSCTAAVLVTVCDHLLRKVSPGVALASYVPSPATWPACGQHVVRMCACRPLKLWSVSCVVMFAAQTNSGKLGASGMVTYHVVAYAMKGKAMAHREKGASTR